MGKIKYRLINRKNIIVLLLLLMNFSVLYSINDSFYAINSLRFFLDENVEDAIAHDEWDIAYLWEKASLDSSIADELSEAFSLYYMEGKVRETVQKLDRIADKLSDNYLKKTQWTQLKYPNFSKNPLFSQKMKEVIGPYLLPLNHPLMKNLEELFKRSRVIENEESLKQAGFETISKFMRVVRHPALPGYLLKFFLDFEPRLNYDKKPGWLRLVERCEGAENIRELIKKENIKHFVVPDKYLYPLPEHPAPHLLSGGERQVIVLVVTDMNLAPYSEGKDAWKTRITPEHLDELYLIISHGYASTYLSVNIPYTADGKFACIDTEYPKRKLNLGKVRHYLSPEMAEYWDWLVRNGGKRSSKSSLQTKS